MQSDVDGTAPERQEPEGEASSGPEQGPGGKTFALTFAVRRRIWREFILALLVLLILVGLAGWYWWPRSALPGIAGDDAVPLDERWTHAESERLANWKIARTGLPSAGPPPARLSAAVSPRHASGSSAIERAHANFEQVAATLGRVRAAAASDEEEGLPQLDSARAEQLLLLLDGAQAASGRGPIAYNRALVYLWSGGLTQARDAIEATGCASEPPAEALNRRGLHVGCLWLRGRLAEAVNPGSGTDDLAAAARAALQLRTPSQLRMIFDMRHSLHLLDADTADLWRDYLTSLLAARAATPLDEKRDSIVFQLALSRAELNRQPELTAMLDMLLARQGKFTLMSKLPNLDATAGEAPRRLASVAQVAAGLTAEDAAPGLSASADATELNNWVGHRCRRSRLLGLGGTCATATPEFAAWEKIWQQELQDRIEGRSTFFRRVLHWLTTFVAAVVILFVLWALVVTWLLGKRRAALYQSKFEGHHSAESSQRTSRSAKLRSPRSRDD